MNRYEILLDKEPGMPVFSSRIWCERFFEEYENLYLGNWAQDPSIPKKLNRFSIALGKKAPPEPEPEPRTHRPIIKTYMGARRTGKTTALINDAYNFYQHQGPVIFGSVSVGESQRLGKRVPFRVVSYGQLLKDPHRFLQGRVSLVCLDDFRFQNYPVSVIEEIVYYGASLKFSCNLEDRFYIENNEFLRNYCDITVLSPGQVARGAAAGMFQRYI